MNKKLARLGEKTTLTKEDVKKLTRIGISGILAIVAACLTGLGSNAAAQGTDMPAKVRPQKCNEVPKEADCKAMFTTYYYDPTTNKCVEAMGCVSTVYKTREECARECIGQKTERPEFPVSKYGAVGIRDFQDAK
jgi:hypothetical protein